MSQSTGCRQDGAGALQLKQRDWCPLDVSLISVCIPAAPQPSNCCTSLSHTLLHPAFAPCCALPRCSQAAQRLRVCVQDAVGKLQAPGCGTNDSRVSLIVALCERLTSQEVGSASQRGRHMEGVAGSWGRQTRG